MNKNSNTSDTPSDKGINLDAEKKQQYCRFKMYVRLRPGYISQFRDQQRNWCYRGDKYTNEPDKMLKNLLNHLKNKYHSYDRVIIYDNDQLLDEREIVKIVDDVVQINTLTSYSEMLINYSIPKILK